jgi:acyl-CoA thioesterase
MPEAVFQKDGERFVPTAAAGGPWSHETLHGGAACGLLARAIERGAPDPAFALIRLTVDLFRAIPRAPLTVRVEPVRAGRRVHAVAASLCADGTEITRASALLLRRSEAAAGAELGPPPPGPAGIATTRLSPDRRAGFPTGFHTTIECRWVSRGGETPPCVWMRLPVPLVEGEETTPLVHAAALADFGNALASFGARAAGREAGYINADVTLYLARAPGAGWIALEAERQSEREGVGFVDVALYDERSRFGRVAQARLLQGRLPGS